MAVMTPEMPGVANEIPGVTGETPTAQNGRSTATSVLLALIPVSLLIAFIVLIEMAANAASATGGCGGG
jgi:hypothetical protein